MFNIFSAVREILLYFLSISYICAYSMFQIIKNLNKINIQEYYIEMFLIILLSVINHCKKQYKTPDKQYKKNQKKKIMSKYDFNKQLRLNVINKGNDDLKISIIVGGSLTMSHLKRKIQTQFNELYNIEIVIKVIEDKNGFIISNNSTVEEHFKSGDTIFFSEHGQNEKTGANMNMASNLGQILSTVRFMTASALQKLDKIDITNANAMELAPDLLHLGFWFSNTNIVQKLYKIFNKLFGQSSIQKFMSQSSQIHMSMLLRNFTFWLSDIPNAVINHAQIVWQLVQLFEKFTCNQKFSQIMKTHKLSKCMVQISKDVSVSAELKKMCVRIIKNINGGGGRGGSSGMNKIKSQYIPSMLGMSNINGYGIQDILGLLTTGSPDQKVTALQYLAQNNFDSIAEATVRFDYYEKLVNIFTIKKLKTKKHLTFFNQAVNQLNNNSSKDQCIQIVQKDIFKKIHSFMLEGPVETHSVCIQYLSKICKVSAASGMFNIQKSVEYFKSPYPAFQKIMVAGTLIMSQKLVNVSSIRFIPGIRDYITLCLKTNDEQITLDLLKIISNLSLDEQCRYQILNLKGIEVFVKFLQTSKNQQICRASAKGLLNLAISSRENKAKVLGAMNTILERFYRTQFDSITHGYIQTILKSKNI